ncbi:hypothetical protein QEZ54_14290 [Catellatospora sp. KI3]|uniref:hypothetical protein n=1 Tax=Catellatospora sp. KI3 TaxID=3041620 RepID=UPI00248235E9|nr:hypothetical protein [Catellatospora sp. KI3]MDI1462139.1 hypothetical protein [Catellatospora sp. KI3]
MNNDEQQWLGRLSGPDRERAEGLLRNLREMGCDHPVGWAQFLRIRLTSQVERDREIAAKYEEGPTFHRARIGGKQYDWGRQ